MPTKRVRIGTTPPLENAIETESEQDKEEAYQISEGKAGLMEAGDKRVTQHEVLDLPLKKKSRKIVK